MYSTAMEPTRYWMWTRRKTAGGSPYVPPLAGMSPANYGESWEEQAFADDSDGRFGGCVWPPRSYSCSFCGREFRSAQALGGHMNVHRRDRARLKQSPPVPSLVENSGTDIVPHHHQHQFPCYPNIPCPTQPVQTPPQICTFLYNSNPNHGVLGSSVPQPLSEASLLSTLENCCTKKETSLVPSPAADVQGQRKRSFFAIQTSPELKLGRDPNLELKYSSCYEPAAGDDDPEEEITSSSGKRQRTDAALGFLKHVAASEGGARLQPEVLVLGHNAVEEELDLELRLGKRP